MVGLKSFMEEGRVQLMELIRVEILCRLRASKRFVQIKKVLGAFEPGIWHPTFL